MIKKNMKMTDLQEGVVYRLVELDPKDSFVEDNLEGQTFRFDGKSLYNSFGTGFWFVNGFTVEELGLDGVSSTISESPQSSQLYYDKISALVKRIEYDTAELKKVLAEACNKVLVIDVANLPEDTKLSDYLDSDLYDKSVPTVPKTEDF